MATGLVMGIFGVITPHAGAEHSELGLQECSAALNGARDADLSKTTSPGGGSIDDPAVVEAGTQIDVTLTWGAAPGNDDWSAISKVLDCVFLVNGETGALEFIHDASEGESDPQDDGAWEHSYGIPSDAEVGDTYCDVGRLSGNPGPDNGSDDTHKSNVVCFEVGESNSAPTIGIEKSPDGGTIDHGDPLTFTIVVTAGGSADSENVDVADNLPDGFDWEIDSQELNEAAATACSLVTAGDEEDLSCSISSMSPGDEYVIVLKADTSGAACGSYDNTAFVIADHLGEVPLSDDADVLIENCTTPTPTISIEKTPDGGSVAQGDVLTFSITVTAGGDATSEDVTISDVLPAGFTWTEASDPDNACDIGGGELTCLLGDMEPTDTYTVSISADTDGADCDVVNNTATVDSTNADSDSDTGDMTITGCGSSNETFTITEETTTTTTTTTTVPVQVLAEEVTTTTAAAAPAVVQAAPEATVGSVELPRTGSPTGTLLVFAGFALALGGALLSASDRTARQLRRELA